MHGLINSVLLPFDDAFGSDGKMLPPTPRGCSSVGNDLFIRTVAKWTDDDCATSCCCCCLLSAAPFSMSAVDDVVEALALVELVDENNDDDEPTTMTDFIGFGVDVVVGAAN